MPISKVKFPDNSEQSIKDSRITGVDSTPIAGSTNVVTSGGLYNLVTIEEEVSSTWRQGTLDSNYAYTSSGSSRIIIALKCAARMTFSVTSGYYASVHSYSGEFSDVNEITSGSTRLGQVTDGWVDGDVAVEHLTGGKTYVVVVKYGSAGTASVSPTAGPTAIPEFVAHPTVNSQVSEIDDVLYGYGSDGTQTLSGTWRQGSLTDNYHNYNSSMATRIIAAFAWDKDINVTVASGYYVAVHGYSQEYTDINQITSTSPGYVSRLTDGWAEGEVSLSNPGTVLTYVLIVKKGSAGTTNIAPSEGASAITSVVGTGVETAGLVQRVETLETNSHAILSGSSEPTSSIGNDGDIYIQTS